jgi:hypothetical protein
MFKQIKVALLVAFGLVAFSSAQVRANILTSGSMSFTCTGETITVSAIDLTPGRQYTVDFDHTATQENAPPIPVDESFTFTPTTFSGTFTDTVPFTPPLSDIWTFSNGSATLTSSGSTVSTIANPITINCRTPLPQCAVQTSNVSNFNGTPIQPGSWIWFNANISAQGVPSSGATITFQQSTITFSTGTQTYSLAVPNGEITFSPSANCSMTSFDTATNTWQTTLPISGSDEIFLTGLAWQVPPGFAGKVPGNVTWNGTFGTDTPGVSGQWKWGAAVYSSFTSAYNALGVDPTHGGSCVGYNNGDHAGTPEMYTGSVIGGARGGGGSNFTGSWTGTLRFTPVCH